tara:strand:+ start:306 stop:443 length:138 start_codon:yes stop_codon:yes gene_type:complete
LEQSYWERLAKLPCFFTLPQKTTAIFAVSKKQERIIPRLTFQKHL